MKMPKDINGKLYVPKDGTFLVEMKYNDLVVTLLFKWSNLYLMAYHTDGVWYYLQDFNVKELPPQTQLPYSKTVKLNFTSSYASLGLSDNLKIGRKEFRECITTLSNTHLLHGTNKGEQLLASGPLVFPVVVISEALRFLFLRQWLRENIFRSRKSLDLPDELSKYFNSWGTFSSHYRENKAVKDVLGKKERDALGACSTEAEEVRMLSVSDLGKMLGVLNRRGIVPVLVKFDGPSQVPPKYQATKVVPTNILEADDRPKERVNKEQKRAKHQADLAPQTVHMASKVEPTHVLEAGDPPKDKVSKEQKSRSEHQADLAPQTDHMATKVLPTSICEAVDPPKEKHNEGKAKLVLEDVSPAPANPAKTSMDYAHRRIKRMISRDPVARFLFETAPWFLEHGFKGSRNTVSRDPGTR